MNAQPEVSPGERVLRILVIMTDTNANRNISGSGLMSQMDTGGIILAKKLAAGCVVIVAVDPERLPYPTDEISFSVDP